MILIIIVSTPADNTQCSVVFTDQQYEVDPVSGDVTVEWAGTGPTAEVNVSEFTCRLPNGTSTDCELTIYTTLHHLHRMHTLMHHLVYLPHPPTHTHAHTHAPFSIPPPPTHTHTCTHNAGTSPFVLTGLAQGGNHTFSVIPHQISNSSMPQCASRRGLIGAVLVIRL